MIYYNIYNILNKLFTNDIIDIIAKHIYKREDKTLLNDIENFILIKNQIIDINYYSSYHINIISPILPENDNYLIEYLDNFYNEINTYNKTEWIPRKSFYDIWSRKYGLNNNKQIQKYTNKLNEQNIDRQINIYLGLLLPEERNLFIKKFSKIYYYKHMNKYI